MKGHQSKLRKSDFTENVVYLFQIPRTPVIPSVSTFCLKLETWLRMKGVTYENVFGLTQRSSEGTVPWCEYNGEVFNDSELAMRDLQEKLFPTAKPAEEEPAAATESEEKKAEAGAEEVVAPPPPPVVPVIELSPEEKRNQAIQNAMGQLCEGNMLSANAHARYVENTDKLFSDEVMGTGTLPRLMKFKAVHKIMAQKMKKRLWNQGIARHKREDIIWLAERDLISLRDYLGEMPFFAGDEPAKVDCQVFSVLAQFWFVPIDTPQKEFMVKEENKNLVDFVERMKAKYWADWDELWKAPEVLAEEEKADKLSKSQSEGGHGQQNIFKRFTSSRFSRKSSPKKSPPTEAATEEEKPEETEDEVEITMKEIDEEIDDIDKEKARAIEVDKIEVKTTEVIEAAS